jgi:hypothetical protein
MEQEYTVIDWDNKDDIQRILTVLECDAGEALNNALQFKYVLELFDENLDFVNKAPCFWSGVIDSLRYSMLMRAARLFDESRDAIGIKKALNIVEQSKYREAAKEVLCRVRNEYDGYQNMIEDIRNMRDKIYAHNDKALYRDWDSDRDATIDDPLWEKMIELFRWAKDSILSLRGTYGDNFPLYFETKNDVKNLLLFS